MSSTIVSLALFCLFQSLSMNIDEGTIQMKRESYSGQNAAKNQAFTVLVEKCNVCHATKKKTDIFTLDNMDSLAADIHKQVFVKRKMPKGRKIKLTESESRRLQIWLDTTLALEREEQD